MFQRLVSHNPDLESLVKRGYAVAFDSTNHLIVRDIPYIDASGELRWGAFVAKLEFIDVDHVKQHDHQVFFAGSVPHRLDGTPVPDLAGGPANVLLSQSSADVTVERSFSNKLKVNGALIPYPDFFAKIENYVAIVSGPAIEKFGVTPHTFRAVAEDGGADPIFKFNDTLTSRAEIGDYAAKLEKDVLAVVGLGGTGSYLLDFLVKSRVKEIRGFDGDNFHIHNAYRAPGATNQSEFGNSKANVLGGRYQNFRHGLDLRAKFIDESSGSELANVTFAFVCVDKGSSRAQIFDLLIGLGIPFIDVGLGLNKKPDGLTGQIRATYVPPGAAAIRTSGLVPLTDEPEDIYHSNIQISELNALNAALAVIKYKQLRGFYGDSMPNGHHIFNIAETTIYRENLS